jgi:hypothetical protein
VGTPLAGMISRSCRSTVAAPHSEGAVARPRYGMPAEPDAARLALQLERHERITARA